MQKMNLKSKLMICHYLKEKEEAVRNELRNQIKVLKFRVGEMVTVR